MSKGEESAKRGDGETGIETLGFAPKDEVLRPGHNLRACWFMHPDEKTAANSSTAFTSFLQVCPRRPAACEFLGCLLPNVTCDIKRVAT